MSYYDQPRVKRHAQGYCEEGCGRPHAPDRWRCRECLAARAAAARAHYTVRAAGERPDLDRRRALRDEWPDRVVGGPPKCTTCGLRGDHACLNGDATSGLGAWAE